MHSLPKVLGLALLSNERAASCINTVRALLGNCSMCHWQRRLRLRRLVIDFLSGQPILMMSPFLVLKLSQGLVRWNTLFLAFLIDVLL